MAKWFRCDACGNLYAWPLTEVDSGDYAACPKCGVPEKATNSIDEIQNIVRERNIQYLLHFTRLSNLAGILEHGIYPHDRLNELPHNVTINDAGRWDFHPDSVSLSVCFPNYLMFYKYRKETDDDWVVLAIDPVVLSESECAFCKHNAADSRISCLPVESIKDHSAFSEMFVEIDGHRSREEQQLKPCDPTDPQAEILVFDVIAPEKILGVVFRDKETKQEYAGRYPDLVVWHDGEGRGMFASRAYVREYV